MKSALIVFLKYPEPGKVKTRLALDTSSEFAAKFYRYCSESVLNEINKLRSEEIEPILFIEDERHFEKIDEWTGGSFDIYLQVGNDLGARMSHAFNAVFNKDFDNAVIIGTDIPDLSAVELQYTFRRLSLADIVIGPSNDGGYYLLGMQSHDSELFQNIEWSSTTVLKSTLNIIKEKRFSYNLLAMLRDIDYKTDMDQWLNSDGGNEILKRKIKNLLDGNKNYK